MLVFRTMSCLHFHIDFGAFQKSKSRAILEDELMPDGARSSDEDRRRSRKKRGSVGEDVSHLQDGRRTSAISLAH